MYVLHSVVSYDSACSSPSLPHDEEQQQKGDQDYFCVASIITDDIGTCIGSKLVINSNLERTAVKILQSQNTTTAWEEDQCAIIGTYVCS